MKMRKVKAPEAMALLKSKREDLKKGIFLLPNLLTTGSLFMGFFSIISSIGMDLNRAVWAIVLAGVFDGLDGRVARLTHTESAFGVEYDSISDAIAFGVAPAVLMYQWAVAPFEPFERIGLLGVALFAICAALRLARFNVQITTVEKKVFNGLPTPGGALMLAATVLYFRDVGLSEETWRPFVLVMVFCVGLLMVSNIRYSSFKEMDVLKKKPFHALILVILIIILIATRPEMMLFALISLYVLSGPLHLLYCAVFKPKAADVSEGKDPGRMN
jgi:CDP-diacylglycerol---serine O-phosphatidyltransferase